MITIIVAVGREGAIGRAGDLAFHISADLKRFKALTTGHTVVMGRRTFESLPKGALPNRRNIVVTRNPQFTAPGVETASGLPEALAMASGSEVFIIGGGEIYRQAMDVADRLEITHIDAACSGADTFFPQIDPAIWQELSAAEGNAAEGNGAGSAYLTDERTGLPYRFATYGRRPE